MLLNKVVDLCNLKKAAILDFSKFQKGGHLGFFQIVFGSKNVAKQSCRSMKFQKGGHLGFFQIVFGSKNVAKQSYRSMKFQKGGHLGFLKKAAILDFFK